MTFEIDWSEEGFFIIVGVLFILGAIVGIFTKIIESLFGVNLISIEELFVNASVIFGGFISLVIGIESAI